MTPEFQRPKPKNDHNRSRSNESTRGQVAQQKQASKGIPEKITSIARKIAGLSGLRNYRIRDLVTDAKIIGEYLKEQNLKTNQIRKFLDAVNRSKVDLSQVDTEGKSPEIIETDVVMLKPKLVYAAARASEKQSEAIKGLSEVVSAAIDQVKELKQSGDLHDFKKDFERLVQLIESIIAYHKAAGGDREGE